jgi:hypothetical protein
MPGKKASTEYSCVVCVQRKVRCDKAKPCQNCLRAGIACEVAPPPPPRRRKRKLDERELVRRLAKYEELMDRNGVEYRSAENDLESFKGPVNTVATASVASVTEQGSHKVVERYVKPRLEQVPVHFRPYASLVYD